MAASPRMLSTTVTITWDGAVQRLTRGTIIDIPPGGPLETAIGTSNLVSLSPQDIGGSPAGGQPEDQEGGIG